MASAADVNVHDDHVMQNTAQADNPSTSGSLYENISSGDESLKSFISTSTARPSYASSRRPTPSNSFLPPGSDG